MSDDVLYSPSVWQATFHSLQVNELLGAGSAGPGKSLCLLMDPMPRVVIEHERCMGANAPVKPSWGLSEDAIRQVRERYPLRWGASVGWALHLRREFPMLDHTIARAHRMFSHIDPGVKWDAQKHMFRFSSGYRFQFGHCKDDKDAENYRSAEYDHIAYDELTQFTLEQYEQINTRLRSSDPVLAKQLKIRAMTNPGACDDPKHPDWVRARFIDPAPEGKKLLRKSITKHDGTKVYRTRMYLPATLFDNPDKEFVRQYEEQLLDKPAHIRQALLYGNWYATIGSFFGEDWVSSLHEITPRSIPSDWPRFRAMDWGFKTNGVVLWFAVDYDGNLICEKEFSFRMMNATDVAKRIKEIEEDMGLWGKNASLITGPADTQLWEERGESGMSKADEMAAVGVLWRKADKKSRARNAERVLDRLRDHHDGTSQPGLMFFKNCRKCIQTIPSLKVDKNNSEEPQKGGDDHWYDAVSYACAYASRGTSFIGVPSRDDEHDDDDEGKKLEKSSSRGRSGYGF